MEKKLYRVVLISKKSYRGIHNNLYKAIVLAESKEDALKKVELTLGKPLNEYGEGFISINETSSDVYTY